MEPRGDIRAPGFSPVPVQIKASQKNTSDTSVCFAHSSGFQKIAFAAICRAHGPGKNGNVLAHLEKRPKYVNHLKKAKSGSLVTFTAQGKS